MLQDTHTKTAAHLLLLALLTLSLYWQVFFYGFVYFDDQAYILENTLVKQGLTLSGVMRALFSTYASNWHPLTWISHMLDVQIFGLNGGAFHTVNALFHTMNTVLLYLTFSISTKAPWRSLILAAIFAIHPLHVESVAWISERKDLLSTFFMLLTILFYIHHVKSRNRAHYVAALLLFFLGAMSKPTIVTLPCILLLLDFWPLNRISLSKAPFFLNTENGHSLLSLVKEKLPFFFITLLSSLMTYYAQDRGFSVIPVEAFSVIDRTANALTSYIRYIESFLFPFNLAVLYPLNESSTSFFKAAISASILMLCTCAAIVTAKKKPWLIVGWLWFLGGLFPMIGVVQVGFQSRADRYTYTPLIGLALMAVWMTADFFFKKRSRKSTRSIFGGSIILLFAVLTFFQIQVWRSSTALFEHALKKSSENYLIHTYLGAELERTGFFDRAISEYKKAITINPSFPLPYNNLGLVYEKRGETDKAILYYKRAIDLNPYLEKPYFNLGNLMYKKGELDKAEDSLKKALVINPEFAAAENSIGYILFLKKKYKEAAFHLKRALRLAPDFYMAHNNLGIIYAVEGKKKEAIHHFGKAVKLDPQNPMALQNLKKLTRRPDLYP